MTAKELKVEIVALTDFFLNGDANAKQKAEAKKQIKLLKKQLKKKKKKQTAADKKSDAELQAFVDKNFGEDFIDISRIG